MGNDMFNDEQLAHLKDRADETERLRLALAEAHARIADLENPDFVNCDGLHADGKYPNTPHRPIGINRLYPCPACTALSPARETDGAVREAALHAIATLRGGASHLLAMSTGAHHCPGCGLIQAEWIAAAVKLESALSSPPRHACTRDTGEGEPGHESCSVCGHPMPPADAATEAVCRWCHGTGDEIVERGDSYIVSKPCRCGCHCPASRTPAPAPSTDPWRACGCADPDNCEHVFPAPAPSAKEGRNG